MSKKSKFVSRLEPTEADVASAEIRAANQGERLVRVPLGQIETNPEQPRQGEAPEKLAELVDSIRHHGILEPVLGTINPATGKFQLVAGHRRLQAARQLALADIPMVIRGEVPQRENLLLLALVENIQRADLHVIDKGRALATLQNLLGKQAVAAEKVGMRRETFANYTRMLQLGTEILEVLRKKEDLSLNAVHEILKLPAARQLAAARKLAGVAMEAPVSGTPKSPSAQARSYTWKSKIQDTGAAFTLQIKFRRAEYSTDQVRQVLLQALRQLDEAK